MDFLSALKELVSVILLCNAATGHEDKSMTESYVDTLDKLLKMPSYRIDNSVNIPSYRIDSKEEK